MRIAIVAVSEEGKRMALSVKEHLDATAEILTDRKSTRLNSSRITKDYGHSIRWTNCSGGSLMMTMT